MAISHTIAPPPMRLLKKILASCLLSFGFAFLLLAVSSFWEKDAKDREDHLLGGLLLGVPPTALGVWLIQGLRASSQQERRDRLRTTFYTLLKEGDGRITPLALAMATGVSGEDAKAYLDECAREFNANFDVDTDGTIFYRFDPGVKLVAEHSVDPQPATASALSESGVRFDVILETVPANHKIEAIKIVRHFTHLGLKESKDLVEATPSKLLQQADQTVAQDCQRQLQAIGAIVMLIPN